MNFTGMKEHLAPINPQCRLRNCVKRLVIESGYLEGLITEGVVDANLHAAASALDRSIDCLNDYLATQ